MESIHLYKLIESLFKEAKETDEFEFCCCLLRIRGVEGPGWDPLIESVQFMKQLSTLMENSSDPKLKTRLLLSLYCHATEIDDVYIIIANLFRIIKGDRYGSAIFRNKKDKNGHKINYPNQKLEEIEKLSENTKHEKIIEVMEYFLEKEVRNAFYHSDYILYDNTFNIKNGKGILIDDLITPSIPLEWLIPKMELGISFVFTLINLIQKNVTSYKKEKRVLSRLQSDDELIEVLLTVDPNHGLSGFRTIN